MFNSVRGPLTTVSSHYKQSRRQITAAKRDKILAKDRKLHKSQDSTRLARKHLDQDIQPTSRKIMHEAKKRSSSPIENPESDAKIRKSAQNHFSVTNFIIEPSKILKPSLPINTKHEFVSTTESTTSDSTNAIKLRSYAQSTPNEIKKLTKEWFTAPKNLVKKTLNQERIQFKQKKGMSFDELKKNNSIKIKNHQQFCHEVEEILKKHVHKNQKAELLNQYIENHGGYDSFTSDELGVLFSQFWDLENYDSAMLMVMGSNNPVFKTNPITLENFGFCALNTHNSDLHNPNIAIAVAEILLEINPENSEALRLLGTAYETKYDIAHNMYDDIKNDQLDKSHRQAYEIAFSDDFSMSNVKQNQKQSAIKSVEFFSKAFHNNFDVKTGLDLMHLQREIGDFRGAKITAHLLIKCCLRDNVLHIDNLSVVNAFVQACLLTRSHSELLPKMELKLLTLCKKERTAEYVFISLREIQQQEKLNKRSNKPLDEFVTKCKEHLAALKVNSREQQDKIKSEYDKIPLQINEETDSWHKKTYSYAASMKNVIPGNLKTHGGQLPSHEVNRYTKDFFTTLLEQPLDMLMDELPEGVEKGQTLAQINDFNKFIHVLNEYLRSQFKIDERNMEVITSPGHKEFERLWDTMQYLAGVGKNERKKLKDDSTNLAWFFSNRLGDCRQVAQCKQIIFDLWQDLQLQTYLRDLKIGLENQDANLIKEANKNIKAVLSMDLKLWETSIFVADPHQPQKPKHQEEHVLNVILEHDENHNIKKKTVSDPFYQSTYPLGKMDIPHGVNASGGHIHLGRRDLPEHGDSALLIQSTAYAGARSQYNRLSGNNKYLGLSVKDSSMKDLTTQGRKKVDEHQAEVLEWHRKMEAEKHQRIAEEKQSWKEVGKLNEL